MDDQKTIQYIEQRLLNNPQSLLFARLADNYLQKNRVDEAIRLCQDGIKQNPDYVTAVFILAKAYWKKGDIDQAETELKKVISHDFQYQAAHKLLGDLMSKTGWDNTAVGHYRDILRTDPMCELVEKLIASLDAPRSRRQPVSDLPPASTAENDAWIEQIDEVFPQDKKPEALPSVWPQENIQLESPVIPIPAEHIADEYNPTFVAPDEKKGESQPFVFEAPPAEGIAAKSIDDEASTPSKLSEPALDDDFLAFLDEKPSAEPPLHQTAKTEPLFKDSASSDQTESLDDVLQFLEPESAATPKLEDSNPKIDDAFLNIFNEATVSKNADSKDLIPPASETVKPFDEPKGSKIASPTLGEIYAAQGEYAKALEVFQILLEKNPHESRFQKKIDELKRKLNDLS